MLDAFTLNNTQWELWLFPITFRTGSMKRMLTFYGVFSNVTEKKIINSFNGYLYLFDSALTVVC